MFQLFKHLFGRKRRFWIQKDKTYNAYVLAIDIQEVSAINIPNVNENGCVIILKSGLTIKCTEWTRAERDRNIKFFLDNI